MSSHIGVTTLAERQFIRYGRPLHRVGERIPLCIWRFLPLRGLCLPAVEGEDCRDGETEQRPSRGFRDDDEREGPLRGRVGEDTKTGSRGRELLDRVVAHRRGQLFTALITPAIHRLTAGFASLAAARSAPRSYR